MRRRSFRGRRRRVVRARRRRSFRSSRGIRIGYRM